MDFYKERDLLLKTNIEKLLLRLPTFCREYFSAKQNVMSKLTLQRLAYQVRNFFDYITTNFSKKETVALTLRDLKRISKHQVLQYTNALAETCCPKYVSQVISLLNVFFNFYLRNDMIHNNPVQFIEHPKLPKPIITRLTLEESNRLIAAMSNKARAERNLRRAGEHELLRDRTIAILFLSTGIRLSELVGLNRDNIDFTERKIFIRRSKSARQEIVYMTDDLVKQLQIYLKQFPEMEPDAPLFVSQYGKRLNGQCTERIIKTYAKIAGINKHITPHKLRATFGTNIYQKTRDIFLTAKMLGHTNIGTTTRHYVELDEDAKRRALDGFRVI